MSKKSLSKKNQRNVNSTTELFSYIVKKSRPVVYKLTPNTALSSFLKGKTSIAYCFRVIILSRYKMAEADKNKKGEEKYFLKNLYVNP